MYITRVSINNFQIHEHFQADFKPGVNAIVGAGDRGKSAIVRAIQWCLTNEPDGLSFLRHWYDEDGKKHEAKQVSVKIEFDNGVVIERTRGKGINQYTITRGGESVELNRFGRDLPTEVVEATGIIPVEIADDDICVQIQTQHEPYFLLAGVSGPGRWKALSSLAGTEIADKTVSSFNSEIIQLGKEINILAATIDGEKIKLSQSDEELKRIEEYYGQLHIKLNQLNENDNRKHRLLDLIEKATAIKKSLMECDSRLSTTTSFVNAVGETLQQLLENQKKREVLSLLHTSLDRTTSEISAKERQLALVGKVADVRLPIEQFRLYTELKKLLERGANWRQQEQQLSAYLPKVGAVVALKEKLQLLHDRETISGLLEKMEVWKKNAKDVESQSETATAKLEAAHKQLAQVYVQAKTCPLCGQPTEKLGQSCCT